MAVWAFAGDVAVGEEGFGLLVIVLFAFAFEEFALVVERAEEVGRHLSVRCTGGAGVDVERDAEALERIFDELVVAVHDFLHRAALFAGTDGDRHAVFVAAADEEDVAALQTQIAHVNIGRHIDTGKMPDVHTAVGIGQGGGDEGTIEFLFAHRIGEFFLDGFL